MILHTIRRLTSRLHTADLLVVAFLLSLSVINVAFSARIPHWRALVAINAVAIGLIFFLGASRRATGWRWLRVVHDWYVPPAVFFSFKELYYMIKPLHGGVDYDDWLIAVDRWVFGVDPTVWLTQFATPWLTELLQIAYTSFYFLFLIVGYELYRRHDLDMFHYFMFTCVYGFFLSYLGYFTLPAVGPRFTLHDFSALDRELPGLWLTPYLRWFVNAGESIPMGVPNDVALAGTQRDVFPSGHTMMTLVLITIALRERVRVRWFIVATGALLIVATVYQRYHYVVDLAAGALFAAVCIVSSRPLYTFAKNTFQTIETRFRRG